MSSYRSATVAEPRSVLARFPQNADSSVPNIVLRTVPLLEVLTAAVRLRLPSFEVKAYV
jgi:hypothetical protein